MCSNKSHSDKQFICTCVFNWLNCFNFSSIYSIWCWQKNHPSVPQPTAFEPDRHSPNQLIPHTISSCHQDVATVSRSARSAAAHRSAIQAHPIWSHLISKARVSHTLRHCNYLISFMRRSTYRVTSNSNFFINSVDTNWQTKWMR